MTTPNILYLCINLAHSSDRREHMHAQAEKFGIELQFVEAVYGKELTPEQLACYDAERFRKYFAYDLTPNEIACTLSHRKAMKIFLESTADYAVILEDDAVLQEQFNEGICELTEHLIGWDIAKLQLRKSAHLIPLLPRRAGVSVQPVYTRRFGGRSTGFLYTRGAAALLHDELERFWLPIDIQIMQIVIDHRLALIGLTPQIVQNAPMESSIDAGGDHQREKKNRRTFAQFLRHRRRVLVNAICKLRLHYALRRHLRRV